MNFPYNQLIETVCLLFSIACLSKKKVGYWNWFIWFMLVVVATEIPGYILQHNYRSANQWLYNMYLPIEVLFISWIIYKLCKPYINIAPYLLVAIVLFFAMYFYESFQSGFLKFSAKGNTFINVIYTVFCLVFYYQLLKSDDYLKLSTYAPFWLVNGIFLFFFGSTACNIFSDYLADINLKYAYPLRSIIYIVLNFILYGCWSYAFLCKYKETI